MPATLGHLGAQALITRAIMRGADIKWVWLGCLIPDLPWILQRIVRLSDVSPYDLRLYAVVQSSLVFCVVMSGFAACFSSAWRRTLTILTIGSALHLLMDAMQTKWANGVLFFAPFDWDVLNFGWFWPEAWPSLMLYGLGLGYVAYAMFRLPVSGADLRWPRGAVLVAALVLAACYAFAPLIWIPAAKAADVHYTDTLVDRPDRISKPLELDRALVWEQDPVQLRIWTGDMLVLSNVPRAASSVVSVKGHFTTANTLEVAQIHEHAGNRRNYASYIGLLVIFGWWFRCLIAARSSL
ncbi:hypothetical protein [Actibacterium sp. 188UL27-1]|uniref:hypothetical protein n=1 Tax=Actibacterium sp. 188UL27-1 TaxID=2786961 RepID=UPI00195A1A76|nr:hypothetical protein [Actibacterium sp. 188UL27-1]MBM7069085.1 hypothetical protein [Actibacterium sp. 188UL27-1]